MSQLLGGGKGDTGLLGDLESLDSLEESVVMLGDLVFDGSDPVHWQHFDYTIRALAKGQTPIFPLLGNHDYCSNNMYLIESQSFNNDAAWKEYSHRFPYRSSLSNGDMQTTWYSHIYGSASMGGAQLGLIWLDSNTYRMTKEQWQHQMAWLEAIIQAMESNRRVRGILFSTHHAPYTNSLVVSGNEFVQDWFVPIFCRSKKSMLLFTGHAHGLEHFAHDCSDSLLRSGGTAPASTI
jgi:hypothetical protein